MNLIDQVAMIAGIMLPLFNIPLIIRIVKRKSSEDISLVWCLGVWACIILMAPSGFKSEDAVWRTYNYFNVTFFTGVTFVTVYYRLSKKRDGNE